MYSEQFRKVKRTLSDSDDSWEEEIEHLKYDTKRTEKNASRSEHCRLIEKRNFIKDCSRSGNHSLKSSHLMDFCSSTIVPARMPTQTNPSGLARMNIHNPQRERLIVPTECDPRVATPPHMSRARQVRRDVFQDPFSSCPESSFDIDCGSSVISLDFGLVSPQRNWCSPPQRIERAQNREWSSPHRVIDRPNPESSPGNWISMKESCLPLRHSPVLGLKTQPEAPVFSCPEPGPRPMSQATYVLPDAAKQQEPPPKVIQPKRKTSVLVDYEPERVTFGKNRTGGSAEPLTGNEKVRRVVDSSGHVVKVSLLGDFEAPVFGKSHEKPAETGEKESAEPSDKPVRNKTTKISCKLSPSVSKPQAKKMKKEEPKEEGGTGCRIQSAVGVPKETTKSLKGDTEEKEEMKNKDGAEDAGKSTQKIIEDLEKILRPKKEKDKVIGSSLKEREEQPKPKRIKPVSKITEEKPAETVEKRKRNIDPKAVQEYIKNQKQKRMEQVKTEKKTKSEEREARKKKLEELRIKTLKLATQSKKKKPLQPTIKVVEPGTEDDVTMSLGLKQTKPKVSYNESVSKLKKGLQQKPQSTTIESETTDLPAVKSGDEEGSEKTLEDLDTIQPEKKPQPEEPEVDLKKPEADVAVKTGSDLNATLRKLAETLHLKIEQKEKQFRSRPVSSASKSVKDPLSQIPSQETLRSVKSAPEENRQVVTVDLETIQSLKSDIKKISENFKVLHEIILDKADQSGKASVKKQTPVSHRPQISCREEPSEPPPLSAGWLSSVMPRPYPYNVFTAFQKKMNIKVSKTPSSVSQGSSNFPDPVSNKYDNEFEALSVPSDRLRSTKDTVSCKGTSRGTSEVNYYSMKEDSGSELSSSILDSEKQSLKSIETRKGGFRSQSGSVVSKTSSSSSSSTLSIATEISSSLHLATSRAVSSTQSRSPLGRLCSDRENLILVTPDLKLISNELCENKSNNHGKNLNLMRDTCKVVEPEELNNSEKSYKDAKSESTITEIIDNLSENERSVKSVKSTNEKAQNVMRRIDEVPCASSLVRKSFFQPEMLHLQFQAELTLLETFQQSLSHFLEAERLKTLSEVNKIVYEKAINTEKALEKEDQAVQTSCIKDNSDKTTSEETDSVKTEIAVEESPKIEKHESPKMGSNSETSGRLSSSSVESTKNEKEVRRKDSETPDFSSSPHTGISFQMLDRMMKDEELRSEHQLALIRLREKTSTEKVKTELSFLEMKKRALKERGGDVEQIISAIKKKQRGILLKYQSEKEEIERLKKMHRIASEERKIMIKQQKQIQQMQMSTNDMIIKLKKRERSPSKKAPLKPKTLRSSDSHSEIPEDIPAVSDSALSESVSCAEDAARHSTCTDLDLSSRSNPSEEEEEEEEEDSGEILRRNLRTLRSKMSYSLENFKSKKSQLELEKYPRKRHSVEELVSWTKRLEEKENHLKELEELAMSATNRAKRLKSLKSVRTSVKDRSTSPFQFQDGGSKTISEVSPSDRTEFQKTSTISEAVELDLKTEGTKTELGEKIQSSASEEIPEQFSKKASTSRTTEYCSESFESPSSSEAPKRKPELTRVKSLDGTQRGIAIKLSLSPRMQSPRRRHSSGSDDSVNLSHTETASEQSDLESRIAALHEQLRKRKLEAERLRREQKKVQRERLKVKEQSLLKQIQAYDAYIQKKKQELEQEYERSTQTVMKPLIKQPKVAEKSSLKRQELLRASDSDKLSRPEDASKDEITEKLAESDSEALEQIKDLSESGKDVEEETESIKEQIESKAEETEEVKSAVVVSVEESGGSPRESAPKSMSLSESLPEDDGSQSESEDQSISIKTTLHSPERVTEILDSVPTETAEEENKTKRSGDEDVYQFDSFESDAEEKIIAESENLQNGSEISEVGTETPSESTGLAAAEEEEEAVEEVEEKKEEEEEQRQEQSKPAESDKSEESVSQIVEEVYKENPETEEKAEKIADSIIVGLILESLNVFCSKKAAAEKKLAEESRLSLQALSSYLAQEIISQAVDDILQIYNRKVTPEEDGGISREIRKRVDDIVSRVGRPTQNVAKTTRDVSPAVKSPGVTTSDADEREKLQPSLRKEQKPEEEFLPHSWAAICYDAISTGGMLCHLSGDVCVQFAKLSPNGRPSLGKLSFPEKEEVRGQEKEGFGQEWIDDDFGLSRTRREAEELRLQQLQIEQEIQQLQAQQEQVPYFYLREIPNKPPPPYTPPGKPFPDIPTSESDIAAITLDAVRTLTEEMANGTPIADIQPSWTHHEDSASDHLKCYKLFLFDLAKHLVSELIEQQERKEEVLPWMRTREHLSRYRYRDVERTVECLNGFVQKQVSILFGFGKKVSKESLIVKWIKKKRDHVDEILVGESQEEEAQWTQYDEDQVTVKNEVTLAILDALLEDTARAIDSIFKNRAKGRTKKDSTELQTETKPSG